MTKIKNFLAILWSCKKQIGIVWLFFFLLSMWGQSPYGVFRLFLISGGVAIFLMSIAIILVKLGVYPIGKKKQ